MPSDKVNKTVKDSKTVPNDRERLAAQFGQLDDLTAGNWTTATPTTIQEAIERIAAEVATLKVGTID